MTFVLHNFALVHVVCLLYSRPTTSLLCLRCHYMRLLVCQKQRERKAVAHEAAEERTVVAMLVHMA